ncbi:aromatic ring-hydroxylating oxygenase subunit alpha [Chelativorans xinjiangense]|uniref:aromatic ring-hydroxylating oxygenase subunit alpha n=1 Tax=Chelativorans xinjiangense TaxID=2681485 RepID=UPI001357D839|nr:aromatic ring-hydroxylating dioxygenase subunit alpha [Chelativorans xinjiangense]
MKNRLRALLDEARDGFSLPQAFYTDHDLFEADIQAIFGGEWLFACNAAEISRPGDYLTLEVGRESIVVLRGPDGEIRAFHNTCRHRGARICTDASGSASRLVCPYHQWVYGLDGRLLHARQMPAGFDTSRYGLAPVAVQFVCGLVYVSMAPDPPALEGFRAAVTPYIAPHQPDRTKVAFTSTIVEKANWKLVIENNRECYHCAGSHPELLVSLVEFALPEDAEEEEGLAALMQDAARRWEALRLPHRPAEGGDEFRCIRLPFNRGAVSFTTDGKPACKKLLGDFTDPDLGSVRMFRAPNNWHHFLSDHILHFRVTPLCADRTAVRTTWLVHEDAVEGVDYDLERLTKVWLATNNQDRALAENNHRGVRSSAYRPGPYAPSEFMIRNFVNWYRARMGAFAGRPTAALARAG